MFNSYPRVLLFLFTLIGLTLSSCERDDPQPLTYSQQLSAGSWRLDQILEDRQPTINGADIKDRFSLRFAADGSYAQQLLADNTIFKGTWKLTDNDQTLYFKDHKGQENYYVTAPTLKQGFRYSFINKDDRLVTYVFSAQR